MSPRQTPPSHVDGLSAPELPRGFSYPTPVKRTLIITMAMTVTESYSKVRLTEISLLKLHVFHPSPGPPQSIRYPDL